MNRFNTTVSQAAAAAAASNDSFTSINISPGLIKRVPKVEPGKRAFIIIMMTVIIQRLKLTPMDFKGL